MFNVTSISWGKFLQYFFVIYSFIFILYLRVRYYQWPPNMLYSLVDMMICKVLGINCILLSSPCLLSPLTVSHCVMCQSHLLFITDNHLSPPSPLESVLSWSCLLRSVDAEHKSEHVGQIWHEFCFCSTPKHCSEVKSRFWLQITMF